VAIGAATLFETKESRAGAVAMTAAIVAWTVVEIVESVVSRLRAAEHLSSSPRLQKPQDR
jgi:hypothetical protein